MASFSSEASKNMFLGFSNSSFILTGLKFSALTGPVRKRINIWPSVSIRKFIERSGLIEQFLKNKQIYHTIEY